MLGPHCGRGGQEVNSSVVTNSQALSCDIVIPGIIMLSGVTENERSMGLRKASQYLEKAPTPV